MMICYKELWICMNISASLFNIFTKSVINIIISTPLKMWIYYKTCGYYLALSNSLFLPQVFASYLVSLCYAISHSSISLLYPLASYSSLSSTSEGIATVSQFRLVDYCIVKLKVLVYLSLVNCEVQLKINSQSLSLVSL